MTYENGKWVLHGALKNDPDRIKTPDELIDRINSIGFLPLFKNEIPGFSVEEHVLSEDWWSDDVSRDPWLWREVLARSKKVAYGKFFDKKAGFISLEWFPDFANMRRNGYDFDSLSEEGLAPYRWELIMKLFEENDKLFSYEMKKKAGFSKNGEKNFNGVVTDLQMSAYLVLSDFRCKINKKGMAYGMPLANYSTPESIWGYDAVTKAYTSDPEESKEKIAGHIKKLFPDVSDELIKKLCL